MRWSWLAMPALNCSWRLMKAMTWLANWAKAFGQLHELGGEDQAPDLGKECGIVLQRLEQATFFLFAQGCAPVQT